MLYRRTLRRLVLVLLLLLPSAASAQDDARSRAASEKIRAFMDASGTPGVAVTVGIAGKIVWSEGFGYSDIEQRVPVWPSITLFRVGSVAKPMTATAVGELVEQGLLDLDAPVQNYVPTFPKKRGTITTRLLGGHLAGIRHYRDDEFLSNRHYDTVLDGLAIFQADSLLFEPGSAYSYSSYGWNLISAVVEAASGQSFLDYMQEHVFGAIGMRHTVPDQVAEIIPGRGRYYDLVQGHPVNSPSVDNSYKWAGGGFLSTSEDLVLFGFSYLYAEVLEPETVDLLWTSQRTSAGQETNYGIGWRVGTDSAGHRFAGHTGGSVGGSTFLQLYPDQQLVVALIANVTSAPFDGLPVQIAEIYLNEPAPR